MTGGMLPVMILSFGYLILRQALQLIILVPRVARLGRRRGGRPQSGRGDGCVLRVCSDAANGPAPDGNTSIGLRHESGRNTLSTDWPTPYGLAGMNGSGLLIRGLGVHP